MKARRARLASPNWRHLQGLDTQCWQRNPPFNYGVVTMVTTYSTPISITLHMALCEGHTTSENPKHQKWKLWLFLPGELAQDGGGGSTVEMTVVTFISSFWIWWKMGGGARSRGIWLDTLLTPPHVVGIRGRATTILHTHIHSWGLPHETRSYAHTTTSKSLNNLKPKVSLPVSPLCFYQIFLLLGRSRGSNSAGLENFNLVYSSPPHHPFHLHVSMDQTVASRKLQLT